MRGRRTRHPCCTAVSGVRGGGEEGGSVRGKPAGGGGGGIAGRVVVLSEGEKDEAPMLHCCAG